MKTKMSDLNRHLFEQLERLNDIDLKGDDLKAEIDRSKAMAQIATQIVNGAKTTIDAMKLVSKGELHDAKMLTNLIGN